MTNEPLKNGTRINCVLCGELIPVKPFGWTLGDNAEPLATGRCCEKCNVNWVIPARLTRVLGRV